MQSAVQKIQTKLLQPEMKRAGVEHIKTKARTSVLSKLTKAKITADQKNQERQKNMKQVSFYHNEIK